MLGLAGGMGENPKTSEARPAFVFDPTPEEIAAMSHDRLFDVLAALAEYDASGGMVKRRLRHEFGRRGMPKTPPPVGDSVIGPLGR